MGLFKSAEEKAAAQARRAEEKAAAQARRAEEKAAAQARRAEEAFARSPVGRATAAHERGDALLQIELPVDESSALILSQIEAIGWYLEHAGYAFIVSGGSSTNVEGVTANIDIGGRLTGVYLFRRP